MKKSNFTTLIALSLSLASVGVFLPINASETETSVLMISEVNSEETLALDQVDAYVKAWQLDDAIALLEGITHEGTQISAVHHKLGDLYLQAGHNPMHAAESYIKAIELAKATEDLESEANAQVALGTLAGEHGQTEAAKNLLVQAQANYETLGDTEQASLVEAQLIAIADQADNAEASSPVTVRGSLQNQNLEMLSGCTPWNPSACNPGNK